MLISVPFICGLLTFVGHLQAEKVFDVEESEDYEADEVLHLVGSAHDIALSHVRAKEVARILANAKDKEKTEFAGRKIQDLVDLNNLEESACLRTELEKRQGICKSNTATNDILIQYCETCMQALREFCTSRPVGKLVDRYLKERVNAIRHVLKVSSKIVRYIDERIEESRGSGHEMEENKVDEDYLDAGLLKDFFMKHSSESDEFSLTFMRGDCQEILDGLELELSHLIDEKSAIAYLSTKYSGGTLAMRHCKMILDRYNDFKLNSFETD